MYWITPVTQFEIKDIGVEFVIKNNSSTRDNDMKIKLNENASGFFLVSSKAYSQSLETTNMDCIAKIVKGSIPSTVFAKSSILDAWLGSEYPPDYPKIFSVIISGCCHFESSKYLSNLSSILLIKIL